MIFFTAWVLLELNFLSLKLKRVFDVMTALRFQACFHFPDIMIVSLGMIALFLKMQPMSVMAYQD